MKFLRDGADDQCRIVELRNPMWVGWAIAIIFIFVVALTALLVGCAGESPYAPEANELATQQEQYVERSRHHLDNQPDVADDDDVQRAKLTTAERIAKALRRLAEALAGKRDDNE